MSEQFYLKNRYHTPTNANTRIRPRALPTKNFFGFIYLFYLNELTVWDDIRTVI